MKNDKLKELIKEKEELLGGTNFGMSYFFIGAFIGGLLIKILLKYKDDIPEEGFMIIWKVFMMFTLVLGLAILVISIFLYYHEKRLKEEIKILKSLKRR